MVHSTYTCMKLSSILILTINKNRLVLFHKLIDDYIGSQEFSNSKSDKIVNIKEVRDGGSFNVTCDASLAGVPSYVKSIVSLNIAWTNGTNDPLPLAVYRAYFGPFEIKCPPAVLPPRNWTFHFVGNLQGTAVYPNNTNTMNLEITVNDATCSDAGLYYCNAEYAGSFSTFKYQNLTILGRLVPVSMTLTPQNAKGRGPYDSVNPAGSNVTLTCNVTGPRNLTFQWKFGSRLSNFGRFTSYPAQNAVSVSEPVFDSSGLPCVQYFHSSTLRFQTEDKYDGYMYVCVASENNRDIVVGNMTIYSKP